MKPGGKILPSYPHTGTLREGVRVMRLWTLTKLFQPLTRNSATINRLTSDPLLQGHTDIVLSKIARNS